MRIELLITCLALGSCAPQTNQWPVFVDGSSRESFDSDSASFEDHIFALSPLKGAVRDSEAYRRRLAEGFQHPKTLAQNDEDFVFIPERSVAEVNPEAHSYQLDRTSGHFTVSIYVSDTERMQMNFFRNEDGWWWHDPTPHANLIQ